MPVHNDFRKIRDQMREQYGKKKGDEVYYSWLNKNDLDDSQAMPNKMRARGDDYGDISDNPDDLQNPANHGQNDGDIAPILEEAGVKVADGMNRAEAGETIQPPHQQSIKKPEESIGGGNDTPDQEDNIEKVSASAGAGPNIHFPSYKFRYTAEPKFGSDQGEVIIKAIVLEQGFNINNWRVDESEFGSVAAQYKAGRQLRLDHSRDVQKVFGKSFDGKVIMGKDMETYMGSKIEDINPEGMYVTAEFVANPTDPQVRMNILKGYVDTGSIGLDANAFCAECNRPVQVEDEGDVTRTCMHSSAGVLLKNVDVKEYSYVAEPAFPHSRAYPSFAAAVDHILESSLKHSSERSAPMSAKVPMEAKADAKAKADAGNTIDDAKTYTQADMDAYAEARMAIYKKGLADAAKFRADYQQPTGKDPPAPADPGWNGAADAEGDAKSEADADAAGGFKDQPAGGTPAPGFAPMRGSASRKTDQIGRTNQRAEMKAAKDDLISRVLRPTQYAINQDPALKELFMAAANAPGAPLSVKSVVKEAFKA